VVSFTPRPPYPWERGPCTHWIGGLVHLRVGLDDVKRKFLNLPDSNSDPSVVKPVTSRYTDYAIPAPRLDITMLIKNVNPFMQNCKTQITRDISKPYNIKFHIYFSQERPRLLRNSKFGSRIFKSPPLVPILSQFSPVNIFICLKIRFSIFVLLTHTSQTVHSFRGSRPICILFLMRSITLTLTQKSEFDD
jgi:hypothetical protein